MTGDKTGSAQIGARKIALAERGVQELRLPEICIREIDPVELTAPERLRPQRTLLARRENGTQPAGPSDFSALVGSVRIFGVEFLRHSGNRLHF